MPLRTTRHWIGVTLDTPDARRLAAFYARLLDWQLDEEDPDYVTVAPSADAGYYLACQTEARYRRPVWPPQDGQQQMSMHLEIEVDDLAVAEAHATACGAALAAYQPQDDVRVMFDPDGHPFCLYLDDDAEG